MQLFGNYKWAVRYIEIAKKWFFACGELYSEVRYAIISWKLKFVYSSKRSYELKQTCISNLQVCLSTCDIFLSPDIKDLKATPQAIDSYVKFVLILIKTSRRHLLFSNSSF